MELSIERPTVADIDLVKRIEIECSLSSWSKIDYLKELDRADSLFFVARERSNILGFALARLIMSTLSDSNQQKEPNCLQNEIEIYNIAVKTDARHRRIGSELLGRIFKSAGKSNVCKVFLEVRKSNSEAIGFYFKNGFETIGSRKNFYANPTEDAILMSRSIDLKRNA